ncbi:MAG: HAD family hydrolase [Gammaproteobacteria bacterium]
MTLSQIYGHLIPGASQGDIEALVTEELALEKRICFAFRPVLDLIAQARSRGMKVIVVSDTYFNETQLADLIASTVGAPDASSLFDALYCSSRYGRAKHDGLFDDVIDALAVPADQVLHIGDNPAADLQGANDRGVRGVHFTAFTKPIQEASRMAVVAGSMLMPSVRTSSPAHELCHALWAQHATQLDAPEARRTHRAGADHAGVRALAGGSRAGDEGRRGKPAPGLPAPRRMASAPRLRAADRR